MQQYSRYGETCLKPLFVLCGVTQRMIGRGSGPASAGSGGYKAVML